MANRNHDAPPRTGESRCAQASMGCSRNYVGPVTKSPPPMNTFAFPRWFFSLPSDYPLCWQAFIPRRRQAARHILRPHGAATGGVPCQSGAGLSLEKRLPCPSPGKPSAKTSRREVEARWMRSQARRDPHAHGPRQNTIVIQDAGGRGLPLRPQSNMGMTVAGRQQFRGGKGCGVWPSGNCACSLKATVLRPHRKSRARERGSVSAPRDSGRLFRHGVFLRAQSIRSSVPVGLINSSAGGTAIEAWTSWDAQKDSTEPASPERWETRKATWGSSQGREAQYTKQFAAQGWAAAAKAMEGHAPCRPAQAD